MRAEVKLTILSKQLFYDYEAKRKNRFKINLTLNLKLIFKNEEKISTLIL
jgi:hypothetical protein